MIPWEGINQALIRSAYCVGTCTVHNESSVKELRIVVLVSAEAH